MKYLIVEDDDKLSGPLETELRRTGDATEVLTTDSGERAIEMLKQDPEIGFISLDLSLNDGKYGMDALKEIRRFSDVPIVILTTDGDPYRQIEAYQLGADGFLLKDVFRSTLAVRQYFESVSKSIESRKLDGSGRYAFEGWVFDTKFNRRLINPDGAEVKLTANEFELLLVFVENRGKILSQSDLMERLRPTSRSDKNPQAAMLKLLSRLRKKVDGGNESPFILNVHGQGFQFTPLVERIVDAGR